MNRNTFHAIALGFLLGAWISNQFIFHGINEKIRINSQDIKKLSSDLQKLSPIVKKLDEDNAYTESFMKGMK